jgi:hypothetical protein
MTATRDNTPDGMPVFAWFAVPDVGPAQMLMAVVRDPEHGITNRPMMYLSREQAESNGRDLAEAAATDLGVTAELREFSVVTVLDRIEVAQ